MPDEPSGVKISSLPAITQADNISDTDLLAGVHGQNPGQTVAFKMAAFAEYVSDGISAASIGAVPTTRTVNGKALSSNISLDADDVGAASPPDLGTITLGTSWSGSGPYSQTVTVSGATVTSNSKIDIQLTAAQIASLISDGVTGLVIENNAGTLTAYAVGATPSASMTVQVTVTEVAA